jgi:hypothetical protein
MTATQGNIVQRHWLATLIILIVAVGAAGTAVYIGIRDPLEATGLLGSRKQQPEPPPPSDKLPGAPGPDNQVQELPPQPGVPPQPPSPIDSETDPAKKPKGSV